MSKRILTDNHHLTLRRDACNDEGSNWNLIRVYPGQATSYAVIIADDNKFEGL